jgi:hypothetical protein
MVGRITGVQGARERWAEASKGEVMGDVWHRLVRMGEIKVKRV